jgi:hypothetical protein
MSDIIAMNPTFESEEGLSDLATVGKELKLDMNRPLPFSVSENYLTIAGQRLKWAADRKGVIYNGVVLTLKEDRSLADTIRYVRKVFAETKKSATWSLFVSEAQAIDKAEVVQGYADGGAVTAAVGVGVAIAGFAAAALTAEIWVPAGVAIFVIGGAAWGMGKIAGADVDPRDIPGRYAAKLQDFFSSHYPGGQGLPQVTCHDLEVKWGVPPSDRELTIIKSHPHASESVQVRNRVWQFLADRRANHIPAAQCDHDLSLIVKHVFASKARRPGQSPPSRSTGTTS